jgi:hypothetical protein
MAAAWVMKTSSRARLKFTHADALGFEQTQRKQGLAHLHGQRLAPARAASQHPDRLAGDETKFTQTVQSGSTNLSGTRHQTLYQGV